MGKRRTSAAASAPARKHDERDENPYAAPRSPESENERPAGSKNAGKWTLIVFFSIWVSMGLYNLVFWFMGRSSAKIESLALMIAFMVVTGVQTYQGSKWGRYLAQGFIILSLLTTPVFVATGEWRLSAFVILLFAYHAAFLYVLMFSRDVRAFLDAQKREAERRNSQKRSRFMR